MKQSTIGRIGLVAMGGFAAFSFGVSNPLGGVGFIAAAFWALSYTKMALSYENRSTGTVKP